MRLEMSSVVKLVLQFREPFWEEDGIATADGQRLCSMTYFHGPGEAFPTWWNFFPVHSNALVGWSGGPAAGALSGRSEDEVLEAGLTSLARLLGTPRKRLDDLLQSVRVCEWQADPLSHGAYSYVPVGQMDAIEELGRSVEGTLFFAGEATQPGASGTVAGAMATGVSPALPCHLLLFLRTEATCRFLFSYPRSSACICGYNHPRLASSASVDLWPRAVFMRSYRCSRNV